MFFKKVAVAAAAACVLAGTSFSALADTLRIGSETVYPPFEFLNSETGKYDGFDIDLINAMARKAGFEPKIISMGLDGLIPAIMSGSIDVAVSALTITKERAAKVAFTKPYYKSGLSIMTHAKYANVVKGADDLKGKVLCAEIGSAGALYMSKIPGTKIRTFNSAAEAFLEINNGGCYAMVNDKPVNDYFLTQRAGQAMKLASIPVILSVDDYGFAVKKTNTALKVRLEKALDEVVADGTYRKIYEKWFGKMK